MKNLRLSKDMCLSHDPMVQTACKTAFKAFQLHDSPKKHFDSKPKNEGYCASKHVFEPVMKVHLSLDLWSFLAWKTFIFDVS